MFLYQPPISKEMEKILKEVKEKFKIVPPHWEFLASINPKRFEMFLREISYLQNHPSINPDFFAFLRLFVANKEQFFYCKSFNTKLLLAKGYKKEVLKSIKEDISKIFLDERHKLLATKAIKAVYQPAEFTLDDIETLKATSWSDGDIYDAIDHASFLFKNARIIKAYSR